jgi:hypothetical protein
VIGGADLPPEISKAIARRSGYQYQVRNPCFDLAKKMNFLFQMKVVERLRGQRFGLAIKTRDNRVIVTEIQPGSMCAPHLQVLDHVIYVDRNRVSQAEVAQTLMMKGMKEVIRLRVVVFFKKQFSATKSSLSSGAQLPRKQ